MSPTSPEPFDENALLESARRKTGLDDFGDESFREPLRVLLRSLAAAPLNSVGTLVLRASLRRSLVQRLRARDWRRRHPEIAEERVAPPIVVVGMMRSGTTLMQRLLARDPRSYSALGWELGEPAPRPGTRWEEPDPRIEDGLERSRQMQAFAPRLHAIHPSHALEPDEEIVLLADAFLSHVPEASCDVPEYRAWLDQQDFEPAYRYLHEMLQLLQWQKRRRGEAGERWVLKSPAHLGYLDTLFSVFPDAHVVWMHRTPLETVPSGASLNATLWGLYSDTVDAARIGRQWLGRMAWATARALAARERLPRAASRFSDVDYREALSDPLAAVERLYAGLAVELGPEARRAMQGWWASQSAEKRPAHRYAADDFGLSEAEIRAAFAEYLARHVESAR